MEPAQVVSSGPLAPCCRTIDGVIRTCQAETCHFFSPPPPAPVTPSVKGRKLIAHINFHSLKMTFNFRGGRKRVGLASARHRPETICQSGPTRRRGAERLDALIEVLVRFQISAAEPTRQPFFFSFLKSVDDGERSFLSPLSRNFCFSSCFYFVYSPPEPPPPTHPP